MRIRDQTTDATEAVDGSRGFVQKHDHLRRKIEPPREWFRVEGVVPSRRLPDQAALL
jgi:hypothetical protein